MSIKNNPFSNATAPNFAAYAQAVQLSQSEIETYVNRGGGKQSCSVSISVQGGQGQYAVLYRDSDDKQIGFADSQIHDIQKMVRIWQTRYPNHRFI